MRILIVDDDDVALEVLERALARDGHQVVIAQDAAEAMDALRRGESRMLITDWVMPGVSGVDLCRQVRAEELGAYIYVIVLTSRDSADDIVEGLSAGADDFVVKPFNPAELAARVRTGERVLSLETRDVAIFAMAKLAESRDPETGEHLERMRNYSRILAQHVAEQSPRVENVPRDFARLIYLTSPLHDIGKVGIPDAVLLKPGSLNDSEFEIMKTHTLIGAATLEAAVRQYPGVSYLRLAREIALTHHERFDGSGYPSGLVGREIPLSGRVVAVADVYDALTSKRVYKDAFAHEIAREMVVQQAGAHFDPRVVQAFVDCEHQFIAVREGRECAEVVPA